MVSSRTLMKIALVIAMVSLNAACGALNVDDTDSTYLEFKELCRTKAGTRIYKTFENVPGFFDTSSYGYCTHCKSIFIEFGYQFVETQFPKGVSTRHLANMYVTTPGAYRYSAQYSTHPGCKRYFDQESGKVLHRSTVSKFGAKIPCVAVTPIDSFISKYRVYRESIGKIGHGEPGKIAMSKIEFSNLDGSRVYAEHHWFTYIPKGAFRTLVGRYKYLGCPAKGDADFFPPRVTEIFKPSKSLVVGGVK